MLILRTTTLNDWVFVPKNDCSRFVVLRKHMMRRVFWRKWVIKVDDKCIIFCRVRFFFTHHLRNIYSFDQRFHDLYLVHFVVIFFCLFFFKMIEAIMPNYDDRDTTYRLFKRVFYKVIQHHITNDKSQQDAPLCVTKRPQFACIR